MKADKELNTLLFDFMVSEARLGSMVLGCTTPLYNYYGS